MAPVMAPAKNFMYQGELGEPAPMASRTGAYAAKTQQEDDKRRPKKNHRKSQWCEKLYFAWVFLFL
jgi:hypothetical protein